MQRACGATGDWRHRFAFGGKSVIVWPMSVVTPIERRDPND
jgi:hypothetical protein